MGLDLGRVAEGLYASVMAPLVLGGALRPGHALGARVALALGEGDRSPVDDELVARVQWARVRRGRTLAPIDALAGPTAAEWALAAALNDLLQAANPAFDSPLRRGAAERILESAATTFERVPGIADMRDALSRHTWFARTLDIARTDVAVSWWLGRRTYQGVDAPARLRAWPKLRRVRVEQTARRSLDLAPLAVDRSGYAEAFGRLLARTPLTDLATCTRGAPTFGWSESTLSLVAARAGRVLALRALARLPDARVDAVLGLATRELLAQGRPAIAAPAVSLLEERALARAEGQLVSRPEAPPANPRGVPPVA